MFNIGDMVEVIENEGAFTGYREWADVAGLTNFALNRLPENGETYKVVCRGYHGTAASYGIIYGIEEENGKQYIIRENAIKKAPEKLDVEVFVNVYRDKDGKLTFTVHGSKYVAESYNPYPNFLKTVSFTHTLEV